MAASQPYPPARHMVRDLRLEIRRRSGEITVRAPAVDEVQSRAGAVGAAAPLRAGTTQVVLDVEVSDGERRAGPAAVASMTFTRISRDDGMPFVEGEQEQFGAVVALADAARLARFPG